MMNRIALESFASCRRASVGPHFRSSGGKITAVDSDDGLDLFSRTRRSDGDQFRLEKLTVGSVRIKGMEDLLDSEIGKHDYDWLLTPPETPLYPSLVARESPLSSTAPPARGIPPSSTAPPARESPLSSTTTPAREGSLLSTAPRGRTTLRSISNTRPSRLSASQTENGHSTRPVRSSSVTRPSISSTYSNSSFSNNNNRTSILNTSSASVTSSRPSTPGNRSTTARSSVTKTTTRPSSASTATRSSSTLTIARPSSTSIASRTSSTSSGARSSSTSRPATSRLPTPTRTRPNPSTTTTRPSNNSKPSTPTSSRPQTPSNPNLNSRANSRPATPTRRPTSSSGSRFPSTNTRTSSTNTRNPGTTSSRPSSPGPRPHAPVRPIDLPDFPVDVPPNLRTKLPERPASAGRTRPGMALTVSRANSNSDTAVPAAAAANASSNRKNYAPPVLTRGRLPENPPKATAKLHGNNSHEIVATAESGLRRPNKPSSATESTGFGRNISKKSLDMALRHMDIRQGMGGIRASSLFPQSIRSAATKPRPARKSDPVVPLSHDESIGENHSFNGTISPDCSITLSENGDFAPGSTKSPDRDSLTTRDSDLDLLHGSSHYDAFMLKEEDSKNMNWLHSVEDNKSDQSPVFDHRFEPLPEPFGLL